MRRDSLHQPTASTPTPSRLGDLRILRSSSMASINRSVSMAHLRSLETSKAPGLWGLPSSQSINNLRNSHTIGRMNGSSGQFKMNKQEKSLDSSDDESLSSDENDLYHRTNLRPSTPPKPNMLRQLRRSSTTNTTTNNNAQMYSSSADRHGPAKSTNSHTTPLLLGTLGKSESKSTARKNWSNNFELRPAKSEYNLNMSRDSQAAHATNVIVGQRGSASNNSGGFLPAQTNSPSSGFWSNPSASQSGHPVYGNGSFINEDKTFDLAGSNPATIPLTAELFQHIVDELNHLATYAKKVYHRSAAANNAPLCNLLAEGVSKTYVNLATIVPPPQLLPGSTSHFHPHHSFVTHNENVLQRDTKETLNIGNDNHPSDRSMDAVPTITSNDTQSVECNSLLNGNNQTGSNSLTSDSASSLPQDSLAMNLLQQYSERLLSMVEQRISSKGSDRK